MSEFEELTKFEHVSIDQNGFVTLARIGDASGRIKRGVTTLKWIYTDFSYCSLSAADLVCIAVWLNQLNGVSFDVSMLA